MSSLILVALTLHLLRDVKELNMVLSYTRQNGSLMGHKGGLGHQDVSLEATLNDLVWEISRN